MSGSEVITVDNVSVNGTTDRTNATATVSNNDKRSSYGVRLRVSTNAGSSTRPKGNFTRDINIASDTTVDVEMSWDYDNPVPEGTEVTVCVTAEIVDGGSGGF
jgi:hypothetical protein